MSGALPRLAVAMTLSIGGLFAAASCGPEREPNLPMVAPWFVALTPGSTTSIQITQPTDDQSNLLPVTINGLPVWIAANADNALTLDADRTAGVWAAQLEYTRGGTVETRPILLAAGAKCANTYREAEKKTAAGAICAAPTTLNVQRRVDAIVKIGAVSPKDFEGIARLSVLDPAAPATIQSLVRLRDDTIAWQSQGNVEQVAVELIGDKNPDKLTPLQLRIDFLEGATTARPEPITLDLSVGPPDSPDGGTPDGGT